MRSGVNIICLYIVIVFNTTAVGNYRSFSFDHSYGLDFYVIWGPTVENVIESLGKLINKPALPPKYSLGYLASSMGYAEVDNAQELMSTFPENCKKFGIPCDLMHLSSGYTVSLKFLYTPPQY